MPSLDQLRQRYVAAQLAGDRQEAVRIVMDEGLAQGVAAPDLELLVIIPAQQEIGRLWESDRISVADEHLATAISQFAVSQLYPYLPRERANGRVVVVACVEGEQHELGARVAADFLEMAGFSVRFLGADVPTDDLVALVFRERPDLVVLSSATTLHLGKLREAINRIRIAGGQGFPIAVGGGVCTLTDEFAGATGVVCSGTDVHSLVETARRLMEQGAAR
jgi:methanogenic corrinoid protein MtbC1